jgi:single-stranded DNA-binding protein
MSNSTTITGNLTREPEIRHTKEGQATARLGVAPSAGAGRPARPRNGRRPRRSSTWCAGGIWLRTWSFPSPRGCA